MNEKITVKLIDDDCKVLRRYFPSINREEQTVKYKKELCYLYTILTISRNWLYGVTKGIDKIELDCNCKNDDHYHYTVLPLSRANSTIKEALKATKKEIKKGYYQ